MVEDDANAEIASLVRGQAFVLSRTFDASRRRVWQAWTECERLKHWWGPKGMYLAECSLDLQPGGVFHYCLRSPEGREMWGKFTFREIVDGELLDFIVVFSDEQGGITRHPMSPTWPLETASTITFVSENRSTRVTVRWMPHSASEEERQIFDASHEAMRQGWGGTLDELDAYLAEN